MNLSTLIKTCIQVSQCTPYLWVGYLPCKWIWQLFDENVGFTLSNSMWIWNTLLSPSWHHSSWVIIFPSAYQKPVCYKLLSGAREHIDSLHTMELECGWGALACFCGPFLNTLWLTQKSSFEKSWSTLEDNLSIWIPCKKQKCLIMRQVTLSLFIHSILLMKQLKLAVDVDINWYQLVVLWYIIIFFSYVQVLRSNIYESCFYGYLFGVKIIFCGNPYFVTTHTSVAITCQNNLSQKSSKLFL